MPLKSSFLDSKDPAKFLDEYGYGKKPSGIDAEKKSGFLSSEDPAEFLSRSQNRNAQQRQESGITTPERDVDERGDFVRSVANFMPQLREMGRAVQVVGGAAAKRAGLEEFGEEQIESGIAGMQEAQADMSRVRVPKGCTNYASNLRRDLKGGGQVQDLLVCTKSTVAVTT